MVDSWLVVFVLVHDRSLVDDLGRLLYMNHRLDSLILHLNMAVLAIQSEHIATLVVRVRMVILSVWNTVLVTIVVRMVTNIGMVSVLVHTVPFPMVHFVMEVFWSVIVPDRLNQHIA